MAITRRTAIVSAAKALALGVGVAAFPAAACKPKTEHSGLPVVIATTTMLGDLVGDIGGSHIEAFAIMQAGGDPHLYQPTPSDARTISRSQLVVTNGLHLEGWIDDLVRNAGGQRPIVVASDGVTARRGDDFVGGVDPHFWFDLSAWSIAAGNVRDGLVALLGSGPAADDITAQTEAYQARCTHTANWIRSQILTIPEAHRVLITSHDAFAYFGAAYGIEVVGIVGISTEQEASSRDVANVIEAVRSHNAPAVFTETSVNPALIDQVARETGVRIAGPLYSDSLGATNGPAGTYFGMVAENTRHIVEALGGTYSPPPTS